MTQVWENDTVVAVTPVLAGPCTVSQVKTKKTDSYNAVQLTFGEKKKKNIRKPQLGHVKKLNINPRYFREFRTEDVNNIKIGDTINVATFEKGDIINVTGTSKGKGFQGVVKRHGFKGQTTTHGTKDQVRMPGSISPLGPAHVFKGTRMGGRMGGERVTTTNLEIIKVDIENSVIYIKGSVPGAINSLVLIKGQGELKINIIPEKKEEKPEEKKEVKEEKVEEKLEEKKEVKGEKVEENHEEKKEVKEEEKKEENKEDNK